MAINSINTNTAAFENTLQINKLSAKKEQNSIAISTGKDKNSFKLSAAELAIANKMTGEARAYEAAQVAQGIAEAAVGVASMAGEQVNGLLSEARSKAILAQAGGLSDADKQAIQNEIDGLLQQVDTTVSTAQFNDVNLVDSQNGQGGSQFNTIASPDGDTISVDAPGFDRTALGLGSIDVLNDAAGAADLFENALAQVGSGLADLGAAANQLENNAERLGAQVDQLTTGVGIIVDADMGQQAAIQTSLDIRSQLQGISAGIANAAPSFIGQMFD